jgi:hypothetical protein
MRLSENSNSDNLYRRPRVSCCVKGFLDVQENSSHGHYILEI